MNIKLTKEQKDLLDSIASIVHTEEKETFYYMPFWFKENKDGTFKLLTFDRLPDSVIKEIKSVRDAKCGE